MQIEEKRRFILWCFLYSFMVKALNTDIDARYTRT